MGLEQWRGWPTGCRAPAAPTDSAWPAPCWRRSKPKRRAGKTLLFLDTRQGDAANAVNRALGWTEAGRIPS